MLLTVELGGHALFQETLFVQFEEYLLRDVRLELGGGTPKYVKTDGEPVIDFGVYRRVLVAQLLGGTFLHDGPCLRGRSVFVRA